MQIIFLASLYIHQYFEVLDDRDKLTFFSLQLSESNRIAGLVVGLAFLKPGHH